MTERLIAAGIAIGLAGLLAGPYALAAAVLSLALTQAGMPLFRAYAMARPNARSSHHTPVPQGGGAGLISAIFVFLVLAWILFPQPFAVFFWPLPVVAAAMALLAAIGAADDVRGLPVLPRLGGQVLAVAMVVYASLPYGEILPLPWPLSLVLLVVAGAWFVNLTNFMDGIDGITLVDFIPLAAFAALLASQGRLSPGSGLLATCFLGALAGFVFFNWPKAKIFLGDVGSLPIGLIGGVLIMDMAQNGLMTAAIILPLYPFMDATITLLKRLMRRERVFEAHRQHAYQNAVDGGWSHLKVSGTIFVLNGFLVGLAWLSMDRSLPVQMALIALAMAAVLGVIVLFRQQGRAA